MRLLESGLQDMAHLASSLAMKQNPKSQTSASTLGRLMISLAQVRVNVRVLLPCSGNHSCYRSFDNHVTNAVIPSIR